MAEVRRRVDERIQHLQSFSVTTKSHFEFRSRHSEHRPEDNDTRQREPRRRQAEQGEGISVPESLAMRASRARRSVEDSALRGMTGTKRKHEHTEQGDHQHYLYPQDDRQQGYYGYRDAILGKEGVVLRSDTEVAEMIGPEDSEEAAAGILRGATR
jgi:hypothetical protein